MGLDLVFTRGAGQRLDVPVEEVATEGGGGRPFARFDANETTG
jgi:hypothetical protein